MRQEQIRDIAAKAKAITKFYEYNAPKLETFTDQCSCLFSSQARTDDTSVTSIIEILWR